MASLTGSVVLQGHQIEVFKPFMLGIYIPLTQSAH